ncbi:MAG: type II toxin-antitoxin system VapC family toxin [Thermoanaerobaculia bacterium]
MILIDSNILMYAAGGSHPHKADSLALLDRVAKGEVEAAVDAEVLQEILHRYRALGRWDDGRRVYDLARRIIPVVLPLTAEVLDLARALLDRQPKLMARDALHAAACENAGIESICSYDRDFDRIPGLKRVEPARVR